MESRIMSYFGLIRDQDLVLDDLPDDVAATVEIRNAKLQELSFGGELGLEFVISDLRRWRPGRAIRVAFLDGDSDLHRDIVTVAQEITDACDLVLDFGETTEGDFRRWTETDAEFAAEIRVSFDKKGYFPLVGIDSIDASIGTPFSRVGGRPNQASLNLGGFVVQRPATWRGTVLHEFLHALGFHHVHQNMRGPCQASFRWEDDPGYRSTQDDRGAFIPDHNGKRPGIYTYLAGFPNFWNRAKVDHNLKTEDDPNVVAGPFDRASVMLYRFPPLFYKTLPSPCAPTADGQVLSDGDVRGLLLLYPFDGGERNTIMSAQERILSALEGAVPVRVPGAESAGEVSLSVLERAAAAIRANIGR
jgi:hypothetical protein